MKCPYCDYEPHPDDVDVINFEVCAYKPFTVTLTRSEIWGLIDDYTTKKDVIIKLKKLIGRKDF